MSKPKAKKVCLNCGRAVAMQHTSIERWDRAGGTVAEPAYRCPKCAFTIAVATYRMNVAVRKLLGG